MKKLALLTFIFFSFFSNNLKSQCAIENLSVDVSPCYGTDTFFIQLNLDIIGGTADGFSVNGNGQFYGNYNYEDLPISFAALFSDCDQEYEFVVQDLNIPDCNAFVDGFEICCSPDPNCTLENLMVTEVECQNTSSFIAQFNFDYENANGSGFDIFLNGVFLEYTEASPPFVIENIPLSNDFFQSFLVCENDNPDCCDYFFLRSPNCEQECTLRDLTWTIQDSCLNNEDTVEIIVNFLYDPDQVSESFTLRGNGMNYGNYNYNDLPVSIFTIVECDLFYEIEARDNSNNECFVSAEIGNLCCQNNDTCSIENLEINFIECGEGQYWVKIDMDYEANTSGETFQININGNYIGSYPFSELPFDLPVPLGNDVDHFTICQNNVPWCCESKRIIVPEDCYSACEIRDFVAEASECDSNGYFNVVIDFIHEDVSDYFHLFVNQNVYGTYSYSDLPLTLGLFEGNGEPLFFNVSDSLFACEGFTRILTPDCNNSNECEISELLVRPFACDNDEMFDFFLNFEHNQEDNARFKVYINGDVYESYSYGDLPLIFGRFEGDGSDYHILVRDTNNETCAEDINVEAPDCSDCNQECNISELVVETTACENDSFYVILDFDFDNIGDDGFTVRGNGNNYGSFDYNNLPIEIGPLASNCDLELEFVVIDNEMPDCAADIGAGVVCCQNPRDCAIEELDIEVTECDSQTVNAIIDFEHSNEGNEYFFLLLNGNYLGQAQYQDLPLNIGPIQLTSTPTDYVFTVFDSLDNDCGASLTLELACDDPSPIPRVQINVQDGMMDIMMEQPNSSPLNVMVFSANGQLVQTNQFREQTTNHRVSLQTSQIGVYFVRIFHESHLYYKKFIFSE